MTGMRASAHAHAHLRTPIFTEGRGRAVWIAERPETHMTLTSERSKPYVFNA